MPAWVAPAVAAAGQLIGMGIAKGKDKRQLTQQEKLQNLQIRGNKEMMDYQMGLERQMWQDTGYSAQMAQMKKAGLNPALLYGMGGGGGQSIGSPTATVAGAMAPQGSGNEGEQYSMIAMQVLQQTKLLEAQKENIEADTELKKTDATKRAGVDTELGKTQIQSLTQGIENQKAVELLTKAQTRVQGLEADLRGRTLEDQVEMVNYETKRACQEAQQAVNDTNVSDATIQDKIKIIKAAAIEGFLKNALTTAQTEKTGTEIKLNTQAWEQNIQKLMIEWEKVGNQGLERELHRQIANGEFSDPGKEALEMITGALNGILLWRAGTGIGKKQHTPIQGFKR